MLLSSKISSRESLDKEECICSAKFECWQSWFPWQNFKKTDSKIIIVQSAGAIEYTDYFYAEG